MNRIRTPRVGIAALGVVLALGLAGCSGGSTEAATNAPTETPTDAVVETPTIVGGSAFCDAAAASLAASDDLTLAADHLSAAMTSGDVDALHSASQGILDNSVAATEFYLLGASEADDPEVKAAFTGLSEFVANYSVPMGEAGIAAASSADFIASVSVLFGNPELQPLLQSAPGWATTARDFAVEHCGLEGAS